MTALDVDDGEVRRSLNDRREYRNHAQHAVVAAVDSVEQVVLNLLGSLESRSLHVLGEELNVLLDSAELVVEQLAPFLYVLLQRLYVLLRQCEHHLALERDSIAHCAAVPCSQARAELGDCLMHEASHELVGVAAALVDLQTRVSALQALQQNLNGSVLLVGLHFLVVECGCDVDAASRTDYELAPCLRVKVEQDVALQLVAWQVVSAEHARLLVGCDKTLNRSVNQCLVLHNSHDGSHADAVVGTESSALSTHPFAVYVCLDRVGLEVVCRLLALLRHHVHVCLKDNTLLVLHTCRCGLAHHDVSGSVLEAFHAYACCEVEQELLYFFKMT